MSSTRNPWMPSCSFPLWNIPLDISCNMINGLYLLVRLTLLYNPSISLHCSRSQEETAIICHIYIIAVVLNPDPWDPQHILYTSHIWHTPLSSSSSLLMCWWCVSGVFKKTNKKKNRRHKMRREVGPQDKDWIELLHYSTVRLAYCSSLWSWGQTTGSAMKWHPCR